MPTLPIARRMNHVQAAMAPFSRFFVASAWARRDPQDPRNCDFVFGNPNEPPLPGVVAAFQRWIEPQTNTWYAYKSNEATPRAAVAAGLRARFGMPFEDEDIFLTTGAFTALSVSLAAIADPGDEVIFISPPWFFYEAMIAAQGAHPVRVNVHTSTFDLDIDAIEAAITARTRAIIINSPHNPTGMVYPPATLERLASLLTRASNQFGGAIVLLSDEAYSRIVFDEQDYHSPTRFYPYTFLLYTYGKTLLTPGQRIGYIALPPTMPQREALREALFASQLAIGYVFPNALLQYALPELDALSIDVAHLQDKRDWMVDALRNMGYQLHVPAGTFYLMVRSPWADDVAFTELLAAQHIFCLPGSVTELPGYFRISLTANDSMIEQALPGFAAAWQQAH